MQSLVEGWDKLRIVPDAELDGPALLSANTNRLELSPADCGTTVVGPEPLSEITNLPGGLPDLIHKIGLMGQRYDPEATLTIRNALKLSTKMLKDMETRWGPEGSLCLCAQAAEVGVILAAAGQPAEVVAAGMFYNVLTSPRAEDPAIVHDIERKFGLEVVAICRAVENGDIYEAFEYISGETRRIPSDTGPEIPEILQQAGVVCCANYIAALGAGLVDKPDPTLAGHMSSVFQQLDVPGELLQQYQLETVGSVVALQFSETTDSPHSARDMVEMRNGLRFAALLFRDQKRRWGPDEALPLTAHAAEVGMILLLAGEKPALVNAGFNHDAFEHYTDDDPAGIRELMERDLGPEVVRLVQGVTEPPKSEQAGNWWERKTAVMEQVEAGDRDLATLSICTKISTIAAGNKWLYMRGGEIEGWSAGSLPDNIDVFERQREQYERKGVPGPLLAQFDIELERLRKSQDTEFIRALRENGGPPASESEDLHPTRLRARPLFLLEGDPRGKGHLDMGWTRTNGSTGDSTGSLGL